MTTEEIMQRRRAEPFRPFRLLPADGRAVEVRHPLLIMRSGAGLVVGIPAPGDPEPYYESTVSVLSRDVVAVEAIEAARAAVR